MKGTISDYRKFTGYSRKTVDEKLAELFGASGQRPEVEDFTKSVIGSLGKVASGRSSPELSEGELDPNQQRARKDAAHADKLEMENDVRRGELLEASQVREAWVQLCSNIRASSLSLPSRVAKELSAMDDPRDVQIRLDEEVRSTLKTLSE